MRISDWSSDVCSSDLSEHRRRGAAEAVERDERQSGDHRGGARQARPADRSAEGTARRGGSLLHRRRAGGAVQPDRWRRRSEEHTSELQSLMRISYAVFCLKKKNKTDYNITTANSS